MRVSTDCQARSGVSPVWWPSIIIEALSCWSPSSERLRQEGSIGVRGLAPSRCSFSPKRRPSSRAQAAVMPRAPPETTHAPPRRIWASGWSSAVSAHRVLQPPDSARKSHLVIDRFRAQFPHDIFGQAIDRLVLGCVDGLGDHSFKSRAIRGTRVTAP